MQDTERVEDESVGPVGIFGDASLIRTETALSRFPVHRIAKKGTIQIDLKDQASAMVWRVSYNSDYGQPGPLAYKIDTLIVNRHIDEAGRPIPKILRLGSLRDICEQLGLSDGQSLMGVKNALLQNASAFIRAKIEYKTVDQGKRSLEAGFTRYSVVFTGETLPDGRSADGVYLILNDVYWEVLNSAVYRPLDYDYMQSLPPAGQRFYEIVSYQIFAALLHAKPGQAAPRAQLRYSEYCLLSTQVRCTDFDHAKKQMYKIHKPHLDSGYLAKVQYEPTTDGAESLDWIMHYWPGPKAEEDYHRAMGRRKSTVRVSQPAPLQTPVRRKRVEQIPQPAFDLDEKPVEGQKAKSLSESQSALAERLVREGVNRSDAERLAVEKPEECERQLEYLPFVEEFRTSRGAYLRSAIEKGFGPPAAFERHRSELQKKLRLESEKARRAPQIAQKDGSTIETDTQLANLQNNAPEDYKSFEAFVEEQRQARVSKFSGMSESARARMTATLDSPDRRRQLFQEWKTQKYTKS